MLNVSLYAFVESLAYLLLYIEFLTNGGDFFYCISYNIVS